VIVCFVAAGVVVVVADVHIVVVGCANVVVARYNVFAVVTAHVVVDMCAVTVVVADDIVYAVGVVVCHVSSYGYAIDVVLVSLVLLFMMLCIVLLL